MKAPLNFISPNLVSIFTDLGESIRKEWRKYNYSEEALSNVAAQELEKAALHNRISPEDVINLSLSSDPTISAYQIDSPFGDLQLITYRHARFYIEVLYWCDGTTAIHDHGFSGAFAVISGSSINAVYDFEPSEKVNHHFWFGNLSKPKISKLSAGSIERIYSGKKFIHSVFHLENPTISVVVRTYQDDDAMPQFEYRGRRIGLVEEFLPELAKKIQGLKFLLTSNKEKFSAYFKKIYLESATDERYWLIRTFYANLIKIENTWEYLKELDDSNTNIIIECVDAEALIYKNLQIRNQIEDSELKLFIALLLNLSDWADINNYIRKNYSVEVEKVVSRCLHQLKLLGYQIPTLLNSNYSNRNVIKNPEQITTENALFFLIKKRINSSL